MMVSIVVLLHMDLTVSGNSSVMKNYLVTSRILNATFTHSADKFSKLVLVD